MAASEVGTVEVLIRPTRSRTSRQSASVKLLKGSRLERTVPEKRTARIGDGSSAEDGEESRGEDGPAS